MKIFFISLLILNTTLFSCSNADNDNKQETNSSKLSNDRECVMNRLIVKDTDAPNKNIDTISEPVAITFFNLTNLLAKHDGKNPDSLPEKLRDPHRQEIYKVYDISGMYYAIIQPRLDTLSIRILDSVKTTGFISFKLKDNYYTIDKAQYQETDGVLLFNGTDKPIFWTDGIKCDPNNLLNCYFKNKNCP